MAPTLADDSSPEFIVITGIPASEAALIAPPNASGSGRETMIPSGFDAAAASINFAMPDMSPDGSKLYSKSAPIAAAASRPPFSTTGQKESVPCV